MSIVDYAMFQMFLKDENYEFAQLIKSKEGRGALIYVVKTTSTSNTLLVEFEPVDFSIPLEYRFICSGYIREGYEEYLQKQLKLQITENKYDVIRPFSGTKMIEFREDSNVHSTWGETAINDVFKEFLTTMPSGTYIDHHGPEPKYEHCDAIVLLKSGNMCPVFKDSLCSVNPLRIGEGFAHLSCFSLAAPNFIPAESFKAAIDAYNATCARCQNDEDVIIAYYEFSAPGVHLVNNMI